MTEFKIEGPAIMYVGGDITTSDRVMITPLDPDGPAFKTADEAERFSTLKPLFILGPWCADCPMLDSCEGPKNGRVCQPEGD